MWPPDSSGFRWNDLSRTALTSTTSRWGGSGTRVRPIFIEPTSEDGTIRLGGTGWRGGFFPYPRSLPENPNLIAQPRLSPEGPQVGTALRAVRHRRRWCFQGNRVTQRATLGMLSRNESNGSVGHWPARRTESEFKCHPTETNPNVFVLQPTLLWSL